MYVVGGDGTHRGANAISREAAKRKYAMSVCGVILLKSSLDTIWCVNVHVFTYAMSVCGVLLSKFIILLKYI